MNDALRAELSASDFSISFWVNRSDQEETIIGFINASNPVSNTYIFARQTSIQNFRVTNSVNSNFSWDGYHDRWVQVTMTFDNSPKQMKIYFDGELKDTVSSNSTVDLNLTSSSLDVGRDARGNSYMDGFLSQILIYDRELTENEVKANYVSFKDIY